MDAFRLLDLDDTASVETIEARWRELRSTHHPDRGGSADEFDRLLKAYREARAFAQEPAVCPTCKGTGSEQRSSGFQVVNLLCTNCGGSGTVTRS
jgi:DnaJ-class molecular chaperone